MKPLLIIDPGHGGKDGGGGSNQFYLEKDKTLLISLYQFARFKELNLPVAITRETDIYLSPTDRTELVKNSGARFCISNHINAAIPTARGVETIHSIHSSSKLARLLYEALYKAVDGSAARRYFSKQGYFTKDGEQIPNGKDYYYMHRQTGAVETVIIEYGFATNEIDAVLIRDYWQTYAEAVVKAFCEYIGHEYKPPVVKKEMKQKQLPGLRSEANVNFEAKNIPAYLTSEGRTVVEVRSIAQALELDINWDGSTRTVNLKRRGLN